MNSGVYSIERESVDSVFFAVVPDAFMTRNPGGRPLETRPAPAAWQGEIEGRTAVPQDRWSF